MGKNYDENSPLTCGEIGFLWQTYQYESLAVCGLTFFLQHVDDKEIRIVLEKTLVLSMKRKKGVKKLLEEENHPIPDGFTDGDVNLKAPRLFSDQLYLEYIMRTLQMEYSLYGQAMLVAVKLSLQKFYKEVIDDTTKLEMETKELSKQKGLYVRAPQIPPIKSVNYIKKDSFLSGWFGKRRPLMALEISEMVFSAKRNALGQAVITAFSQVATSKKVREFMVKGRELSEKQMQVFMDKLGEEYLPSATLKKTDQITTSTEAPFSDKLMTSFITTLIGSSIGDYGVSMSMSPRHDLGVMYTRLIADIAAYSNEGTNLMIDNAWMEQPPMAADRKELSE